MTLVIHLLKAIWFIITDQHQLTDRKIRGYRSSFLYGNSNINTGQLNALRVINELQGIAVVVSRLLNNMV